MLNTYEKHSRAKLAATLITILVIAGVVVLADHLKSQPAATAVQTSTNATTAPTTTNSATSGTASSSTSNSGAYKDGTYTASSDYFVPHGDENIQVSLTLSGGKITDASIKNSENDGTSAAFQEEFAADYKSYVVGKPISGLRLSVVAGASDTSQAFNDAVSQIASKAQG